MTTIFDEMIEKGQIDLCTFPDSDDHYCKQFTVDKDWLIDILERMDALNNREGVDLICFLENYVWDETWAIYLAAKANERVIEEKEVE